MPVHASLCVQTTLDCWVTGFRRRPCFLERLPLELFLEILGYLPFETKCVKRHCAPFDLPLAEDRSRFLDPEANDVPPRLDALSVCPANRRFENGCEEYCSKELYPWNWVEVTRVSRAWRSACLELQQFWTRVPLHTSTLARHAIQRSGELLLQVYFSAHQYQRRGLGVAFNLAADRIRELSISCSRIIWQDYAEMTRLLETSHLPALQRLHFWSDPDCVANLQGIFKGLVLPSLQHIELEGMTLARCPNLLSPTLVYLQLSFCHDIWKTARDLAKTLRSAPSLRELLLFGDPCFPKDMASNTYALVGEPVDLHRLRNFRVSADARIVLNLLATVSIPFTSSVGITLQHTKPLDSNYRVAFTAFLSKQLRPTAREIHSFTHTRVQIERHNSPEGKLGHWILIQMGWGPFGSAQPLGSPPYFTIQHTWNGAEELTQGIAQDVHSLMDTYMPVLPCSSVESLTIEPWVYSSYVNILGGSDAFLLENLVHFANIRHLVLALDIEDILIWLLRDTQSEPCSDSSSELIFPALQTLEIQNSCIQAASADRLRSYIHRRRNVFGRPCTVTLMDCFTLDGEEGERDFIMNLRSRVPEVQFMNNVGHTYPDLDAPLSGVPDRWFM
ncbi:unnamed protein product [Peniophora sp. CBMAI 1063]|nr:unnamed protein product [Peniophora sp. CBMAI 1063]